MSQTFTSNNDQPAVQATNTSTGGAIFADGTSGPGLAATSVSDVGVHSANHSEKETAIFGINDTPGKTVPVDDPNNKAGAGSGVWGHTRVEKGVGVVGSVEPGLDEATGVVGLGITGVLGRGVKNGLVGQTTSNTDAGVNGRNDGNGFGVFGLSQGGDGVQGVSSAEGKSGVAGIHEGAGNGIFGQSTGGDGVHGESSAEGKSGMAGIHRGAGNGVFGQSTGGAAGFFNGNVVVTGDITLTNGDCAEDFDISEAEEIESGTVMVLNQEGQLQPAEHPYDKRVTGVVSGAGGYKPAIVLDKQQSAGKRAPIALLGKVYCKVDAQYSPVALGDLLTTSPTRGHAMKATDPLKAFGSVIGKALRPLNEGREMIPILVTLQ